MSFTLTPVYQSPLPPNLYSATPVSIHSSIHSSPPLSTQRPRPLSRPHVATGASLNGWSSLKETFPPSLPLIPTNIPERRKARQAVAQVQTRPSICTVHTYRPSHSYIHLLSSTETGESESSKGNDIHSLYMHVNVKKRTCERTNIQNKDRLTYWLCRGPSSGRWMSGRVPAAHERIAPSIPGA